MTLRKKTLITIGLTFLVLIGVLYGVHRITITDGFKELEQEDTELNVQRTLNIVSAELSELSIRAYDSASWDDTYAFIEDGNSEYIDTNLVDGTFISLRLNVMLFINDSGDIVLGKAFDLEQESEMAIPEDLNQHLSLGDPLVSHSDLENGVKGTILLSDGPMLVFHGLF
ncbi:MAG: hypothetical protein FJ012_05680 [Chloroflexi bacterium]|nr:hypothetical protein [Chloroflexota bacterium]